ncbi:uncharacterized protein LOC108604395 [Drosophila busckii]|nr:uncharacterized protein LOC108604395 [Drosophila busckii]
MQVKLLKSAAMLVACLLLLQQVAAATNATYTPRQTDTRISWLAQLKQLHQQLHECYRSGAGLWFCFRARSLQLFEDIMNREVIQIFEGVKLAASNANLTLTAQARQASEESKHNKHLTWFDQLAVSLAKGLTTHTLQINLAKLTERYLDNEATTNDSTGTARVRRQRFNMIITMMFGVTALGAILVPMGFQMLSVVSGKALLLAKMALLLASINGLKRVANTGLHYGLYHVPGEQLGGYYDRGDVNHARNVPIPMTLDMGFK